ncbi:hypothetical protein DFR58_10433 [Anaerobacterium chartisolvens]|uniref:Uncharacterized protein n=1 Tax=Anaerobacterium chartisolvens TaxID=1297424 RepID=A0A369BGE8_9FIRM|nr:hypothetical protein [Anaerobacterium chartisolvens]RCX18764.1 hypothetical protein DFR58_10433 [Anaerobacterium chartisolvens]
MRSIKGIKIIIIAVALVFIAQAAYGAYHMVAVKTTDEQQTTGQSDNGRNTEVQPAAQTDKPDEGVNESVAESIAESMTEGEILEDEADYSITQNVLDCIKAYDPEGYTRNVDNYSALLKRLNVHTRFKIELERHIKEGAGIPDILTAYSFLNDRFGRLEDIERLLGMKARGQNWEAIFKEYVKDNPEFVPTSFDSEYLDKLLETPGITQDDIMMADRVSQRLGISIGDIIAKKQSGMSWRLINAGYGIVNGDEQLPRVPVTHEKLEKHCEQTGLSQKRVVEALVMASKLGVSDVTVLEWVKKGLSNEGIYARAYEEKYYFG